MSTLAAARADNFYFGPNYDPNGVLMLFRLGKSQILEEDETKGSEKAFSIRLIQN